VLADYPNTYMAVAKDAQEAERFWKDRKRLGAIAARTNAFKLNEDIVLPSMLPFAIIKEKGDRRHENYTVESGHKQAASAKHYQMIDQIKELNNQTNDTLAFAEIQSNASNKEIRPLNEIIDESIQAAIELCQGNVAEASQKLGVSASTIYRKLKN